MLKADYNIKDFIVKHYKNNGYFYGRIGTVPISSITVNNLVVSPGTVTMIINNEYMLSGSMVTTSVPISTTIYRNRIHNYKQEILSQHLIKRVLLQFQFLSLLLSMRVCN